MPTKIEVLVGVGEGLRPAISPWWMGVRLSQPAFAGVRFCQEHSCLPLPKPPRPPREIQAGVRFGQEYLRNTTPPLLKTTLNTIQSPYQYPAFDFLSSYYVSEQNRSPSGGEGPGEGVHPAIPPWWMGEGGAFPIRGITLKKPPLFKKPPPC